MNPSLPMPWQSPGDAQRYAAPSIDALRGRVMVPLGPSGHQGALDVFDALRSPLLLACGLALTAPVRSPGRRLQTALRDARRVGYLARETLRHERHAPCEVQGQADVLFVPRQKGHLADLVPLATALGARGHKVAFADTRQGLNLKGVGKTPVFALGGRTFPSGTKSFRFVRHQFSRALQTLRTTRFDEDATLHGVLRDALTQVTLMNLALVLRCANGAFRLLKRLGTRTVVVGNPYTMEGRTVALVARLLRVKSACLEHGSVFAGDPLWAHCPLDAVLAWGDDSAAALVASGVPRNAVKVTGAIRLDDALAGPRGDVKDVDVLVATSGPGDLVSHALHRRFIAELNRALDELDPSMRVVVKLHPKDDPSHYPSRSGTAGPHFEVTRGTPDVSIYNYIARAKSVVTVSSTCAVETMALGVPVIAWAPPGPYPFEHVSYLNERLAVRASGAPALARAIEAAVSGGHDAARESRVADFAARYFANVGRALEVNTDAVINMIRPADGDARTRAGGA